MNDPNATNINIAVLIITFFVWAILLLYLEYRVLYWKRKFKKSNEKVYVVESLIKKISDSATTDHELQQAFKTVYFFFKEKNRSN